MAEVLLVDDDGSVLLTLAIALRRQGHNVTVAGDATQALSHLQRHRFEFLISDVRMPGLSGVELAQRVRTMGQPPKVILTSAYPHVETRGGLAQAFLQKPLDLNQLNELLHASSSSNGGSSSGFSNNGHSNDKTENTASTSATRYDKPRAAAPPSMGNFGFATR
jgi:DNA-binding NtrC family response regulator